MQKDFNHIKIKDLPKVFQWIVEKCGENNNFFLIGNLGAGKTTFVREFCQFLKLNQLVTSPTFSLINQYEYASGILYHIDLYRLEAIEEAYEIGIDEILAENEVKFIEWANKFPELMISGYRIDLEHDTEVTRNIKISKVN